MLEKQFTVTSAHTAARVGSGGMEVLATPTMVAWMENVALKLAAQQLDDQTTTVGAEINVKHLKASPVGEQITVKAELVEQDGRKMWFEINCYDSSNALIGSARHLRVAVNAARFMAKF